MTIKIHSYIKNYAMLFSEMMRYAESETEKPVK